MEIRLVTLLNHVTGLEDELVTAEISSNDGYQSETQEVQLRENQRDLLQQGKWQVNELVWRCYEKRTTK